MYSRSLILPLGFWDSGKWDLSWTIIRHDGTPDGGIIIIVEEIWITRHVWTHLQYGWRCLHVGLRRGLNVTSFSAGWYPRRLHRRLIRCHCQGIRWHIKGSFFEVEMTTQAWRQWTALLSLAITLWLCVCDVLGLLAKSWTQVNRQELLPHQCWNAEHVGYWQCWSASSKQYCAVLREHSLRWCAFGSVQIFYRLLLVLRVRSLQSLRSSSRLWRFAINFNTLAICRLIKVFVTWLFQKFPFPILNSTLKTNWVTSDASGD